MTAKESAVALAETKLVDYRSKIEAGLAAANEAVSAAMKSRENDLVAKEVALIEQETANQKATRDVEAKFAAPFAAAEEAAAKTRASVEKKLAEFDADVAASV